MAEEGIKISELKQTTKSEANSGVVPVAVNGETKSIPVNDLAGKNDVGTQIYFEDEKVNSIPFSDKVFPTSSDGKFRMIGILPTGSRKKLVSEDGELAWEDDNGDGPDPASDSDLAVVVTPPLDVVSGQVSAASGAQSGRPSFIGHAFSVPDYFKFKDGDVFCFNNVNSIQNVSILAFAIYRWDREANELNMVAISENAADLVNGNATEGPGFKMIPVHSTNTGIYSYISPLGIHYMVTICDAVSLQLAGLESLGQVAAMNKPYLIFKKQAQTNASTIEQIITNHSNIKMSEWNPEQYAERICAGVFHSN